MDLKSRKLNRSTIWKIEVYIEIYTKYIRGHLAIQWFKHRIASFNWRTSVFESEWFQFMNRSDFIFCVKLKTQIIPKRIVPIRWANLLKMQTYSSDRMRSKRSMFVASIDTCLIRFLIFIMDWEKFPCGLRKKHVFFSWW